MLRLTCYSEKVLVRGRWDKRSRENKKLKKMNNHNLLPLAWNEQELCCEVLRFKSNGISNAVPGKLLTDLSGEHQAEGKPLGLDRWA